VALVNSTKHSKRN